MERKIFADERIARENPKQTKFFFDIFTKLGELVDPSEFIDDVSTAELLAMASMIPGVKLVDLFKNHSGKTGLCCVRIARCDYKKSINQ